MNIAYFELKMGNFFEDYSINPRKYGGGPVFGRWAKELLNDNQNNFYIFGPKECFENLSQNERRDRCIPLSEEMLSHLRNGGALPNDINQFDIICHHHTCFGFSRYGVKIPIVHWSGFGRGDAGHPNNDYILLYTPGELPKFGEKHKYVKIGKPVPKNFITRNKEKFIFQCSQHCDVFGSELVADICNKNNIPCYFAGPITQKDYLLPKIDNINTFYLGQISEEMKNHWHSLARLTTYLHEWDTVFNQSVIESWAFGTPILARTRGFFKRVLNEQNGFVYTDENSFLNAYENAHFIDQRKCWESAKEFSVEEMIESFKNAFNEILSERYI